MPLHLVIHTARKDMLITKKLEKFINVIFNNPCKYSI